MTTSADASTTIYYYAPTGERLAQFSGGIGGGRTDFVALDYANGANAVGTATLTLHAGSLPESWIGPDYQIEITRSESPSLPETLEGDCRWFVQAIERDLSNNLITLTAYSSAWLLVCRDVRYAAGSAQASKTAAADDMIKAVARENLGSFTTDTTRQLASSRFQVAADMTQGPIIGKSFSRKNVLQVAQEIASTAAQNGTMLYFDVIWTGLIYELRTYIGQRGTDRSITSRQSLLIDVDDLGKVIIREDYTDERTSIEAAGQGTEASRDSQIATSTQVARSPWSYKEATISATGVALGNTAALLAEAQRGVRERRGRTTMSAEMIANATLRYGVTWGWGDRLTAQIAGKAWDVRIDSRRVTIRDGKTTVTAQLRAETIL